MKRVPRDEHGFTLIELLVVIIIIGILATVAIPTFLKQREKGYRSGAVADMKNAAVALETYATEQNGSYAGLNGLTQDSALLAEAGFRRTEWVTASITSTATSYCIQGASTHLPDRTFVYRSTEGSVEIGLTGTTSC